jgi:hypothetical protein
LAGWAAAYVLGVDYLDGLDPLTMSPLPITVNLGGRSGRLDTSRVVYVRDRLPATHLTVRHGVSVTTSERTAFDGARWASSLVEAVVFLDQVGHALRLDSNLLDSWCTPGGRWPGISRLRQALALTDRASASPWESRLRMFYILQARLPRPGVNKPIFNPSGDLLGIADLFDPEAGLVTEFDGQDHRKRTQHRADNLREERLEEANLVVCRVDSLDLHRPRSLTDRLRARYRQGRQRDRQRDQWTLTPPPWWRRQAAS